MIVKINMLFNLKNSNVSTFRNSCSGITFGSPLLIDYTFDPGVPSPLNSQFSSNQSSEALLKDQAFSSNKVVSCPTKRMLEYYYYFSSIQPIPA
jgi:hypothetical protein